MEKCVGKQIKAVTKVENYKGKQIEAVTKKGNKIMVENK